MLMNEKKSVKRGHCEIWMHKNITQHRNLPVKAWHKSLEAQPDLLYAAIVQCFWCRVFTADGKSCWKIFATEVQNMCTVKQCAHEHLCHLFICKISSNLISQSDVRKEILLASECNWKISSQYCGWPSRIISRSVYFQQGNTTKNQVSLQQSTFAVQN